MKKYHMVYSPDFTPTDEDPKFLWIAIRLLGRRHVERIAAKVLAEAFPVPCSTAVVRLAVNEQVGGSIPPGAAT